MWGEEGEGHMGNLCTFLPILLCSQNCSKIFKNKHQSLNVLKSKQIKILFKYFQWVFNFLVMKDKVL